MNLFFEKINQKTLLAVLLILYSLFMSVPWYPLGFGFSLDESFQVVLHKIFGTDIQFGKDFIYTYGPYGILQTNIYIPETYTYLVVGRIFLGVTWGLGLFKIIFQCWQQNKYSILFFIPFYAFFINAGMEINAFYFMFITLPLLIYFYVNEGKICPILLLTIVAIGMTGLIKQTYLTLGFAFIILMSIDEVFHRKRKPIVLSVYLVSVVGFWIIARQELSNIGTYLANNSEIIKGFEATMGLVGPVSEIYWYLVSMGTFCLLILVVAWRHPNKFALLPGLGLVLLSFLIFKASFLRHDAIHAIVSAHATVPIACLYSALLWPDISSLRIKKYKIYIPIIFVVWTLIFINAKLIFNNNDFLKRSYGQYYLNNITKINQSLGDFLNLATGRTNLQGIYDRSLAAIRAANPMPEMSGTADLYTNETAVIFAYGLPYKQRPVIQSFSAYTDKLARLNQEHLLSSSAAETLLFNMLILDGRLPSSEDGLSWPELLTRYDITDRRGKFLLLERLTSPRPYSLTPLKQETAKMGEWVELSDNSAEPIWMRADIAPTLAGRFASLFLRLPPLYIQAETLTNTVESYRVFPELMKSGQLISPLIRSTEEYLFFASPRWRELLRFSSVKRIRLVTRSEDSFAYPNSYSLSLSRLDFPPQNFSGVSGWLDPHTKQYNLLSSYDAIKAEGGISYLSGLTGKLVLLARAPSRIETMIPSGMKKLSVGYGIADIAWQRAGQQPSANKADGVEFRILAISADGKERVLFTNLLNPVINSEDRGVKKAEINLTGVEAKKIILETLPRQNSLWDWSYWSETTLE